MNETKGNKMKDFFRKVWAGITAGLLWVWQGIKKFADKAYMKNTHIWMYAVGGALFGLMAHKIGFINNTLTNSSWGFIGGGIGIMIPFLFALKVYAISEMKKTGKTIKQLFGSYFNYIADVFGDCTITLFVTLVVLLA